MNLRITLLAALLLPSLAMAQAYDPRTGQRYDQFGRPLPSLAELCREGQMAGGPITLQCGQYDLRFNRKGERLVRYRFERWGYNVLDNGVTEREARRLDSDPAFRAKYIKQHGYDKYKVNDEPPARIAPAANSNSDTQCHAEADLAYQVAQASAQGIPIETTRATFAKVLNDNHVSAEAYNSHMRMINRTYAWQKHGYSLEQIREGDFQACRGTPTLWVP
ncbi:hypothetical protein WK73_04520 [Burkholderia ubonensis]|uniref:hypothetical protein n=1 Tax=Burkholderia ubonensis TaxID=101571 RepID=UPI000757BB5E|nr:hypothetical protein [Burkholderia ubonensis]KVU80065.1 hypothetical protein WK73_04520 [Burkholderia ubonensis]